MYLQIGTLEKNYYSDIINACKLGLRSPIFWNLLLQLKSTMYNCLVLLKKQHTQITYVNDIRNIGRYNIMYFAPGK